MDAHAKGSLKKAFTSFLISSGIILHNVKLWMPSPDLQLELITAKHNHPTSGHMGCTKLTNLVTLDFSRRGILPMVKKFLQKCLICARTKPSRDKPHVLLLPLQQPSSAWSSILVDFVVSLPDLKGLESVMIVVDC